MDKVLFILLSWCWSYLTWFSWPWCWPWCCIFLIFFLFTAIIHSTSMLLTLLLAQEKAWGQFLLPCLTGADANSQHLVAHFCSWWSAVITVQCCWLCSSSGRQSYEVDKVMLLTLLLVMMLTEWCCWLCSSSGGQSDDRGSWHRPRWACWTWEGGLVKGSKKTPLFFLYLRFYLYFYSYLYF